MTSSVYIVWTLVAFGCGNFGTSIHQDYRGLDCSRSTLGFDYTGRQNRTRSGRTCQTWTSQFPHRHKLTDPRQFPDATVADASNFCRNPATDVGPEGPWCYTIDPSVRWEYCAEVPLCSRYPECRLTDAGTEYRGRISRTRSGRPCIRWPDNVWTDGEDRDRENYCRNPDSKPEGPWCYTDGDSWEFCRVPFCKPSAHCRRTRQGREYIGTVSATASGLPCQRWDSQYPHRHGFTDPSEFPDTTLSTASDFCRNPDGRTSGPWCYTRDPEIESESCDIPICTDCKTTDTGVEYAGSASVTLYSQSCFPWKDLTSSQATSLMDSDRFPDASIADASNFCRNPDRKVGGPWCYWADDPQSWDYCNIHKCTGNKRGDSLKPRLARHVLHIGVDGLHPCFVNSSRRAPNIMNRLAAAGTFTLTRGRTVLTSVSAPAWTAILCGLPVESSGVTDNSWRPPWLGFQKPNITPTTGQSIPFPCIWTHVKSADRGIRTAAFSNWDWFWYVMSLSSPPPLDVDFYCDYHDATCDSRLVTEAVDYLTTILAPRDGSPVESSYTFVYLSNVDVAGHEHGWCGKNYMSAVDEADRLVGRLLDAVDRGGDLADDNVLVLLSTDHGGNGKSHGAWRDSDIVVPVFARGPGFTGGAAEFHRDVRNVDFAPTVAEALGLKSSPWWKGSALMSSNAGGLSASNRRHVQVAAAASAHDGASITHLLPFYAYLMTLLFIFFCVVKSSRC